MKLISFQAKNFKGIEDVRIPLDGLPNSNVYCFVGLNESGKTTVLESLDAYRGWTETLKPVTSSTTEELDKKRFIPKSKISNFTGKISVVVTCLMEEPDLKAARDFADKELGYSLTEVGPQLIRYQHYSFEDSIYLQDDNRFTLIAKGTKGKSKKVVDLPEEELKKLSGHLSTRLPAVLYFPNALFDTPDQIILEESSGTEKDAYYRKVLQDALDAIGEKHDLQKHITARIGIEDQKEALENTVRKLEQKISKVVFELWKSILGKTLTGKKITLEPVIDGGVKVLRIRYADGADSYKISERSLGFRWFFGFLLLTHFRKARLQDHRQVIYVFDEPASNLHSSAQKKLLETFGHLAKQSPVLYSTHSHHLINPDWLENAYVVRNTGLTYEDGDDDYSSPSTKVEVERYRAFVAQHPDQTTYFQPILDVLDYQPSKLEFVPKVIFCEGKNDYYTLRMFQQQSECPAKLKDLKIVPGNGGNGLDPLIKLYSGWGASFQILLDSDRGGAKGKKQYEKTYGFLVDDRVHTIDDLVSGHSGAMEAVLSVTDKEKILEVAGQKGKAPEKSLLNKCLQECCARGLTVPLEKATVQKFEAMLKGLADKL